MKNIKGEKSEEEFKQKLIELYQKLGSYRKVGKELGCSNVTVANYLKKYNLYVKKETPNYNHNIFKEDNEISFYLAGVWAADGNVRKIKGGHNLRLSISQKDLVWINEIAKKIKYKKIKKVQNQSSFGESNLLEISLFSKQMYNDISRFNVVPNKTFIYNIPEFVLSSEFCHHFLRGMVDGDGCFYIKNKSVNFNIIGTLETCIGFEQAFSNVGIKTIKDKKIKKVTNDKNTYSLSYGGNSITSAIHDYLYGDATIFLERKKIIASQSKNFLQVDRNKIRNITKKELESSYNNNIKLEAMNLGIDQRTYKKLLIKHGIIEP